MKINKIESIQYSSYNFVSRIISNIIVGSIPALIPIGVWSYIRDQSISSIWRMIKDSINET
jgi:hypothetical protein